MVLSMTVSAFAIETGDRISYQSQDQVFSLIDESGYIGACALYGPEAKPRGIATATVFSHTNRTAKIAYHWGVELDWAGSKMNEPLQPGWAATKFWGLTSAIQASQMGVDTWAAASGITGEGLEYVRSMVNQAESLPATPDNFECVYADAEEGWQNFVIWKNAPATGKVKLKKVSSNTSITG